MDIGLREVGAKRRLNGTKKVNTHTHGQTDGRTEAQRADALKILAKCSLFSKW